nr:uncharacterized protein LOC114926117 [Arachis hypogaea]
MYEFLQLTSFYCRPYCISSRVLPLSRSRCSAALALLLCSSSAAHHPPGLQFRGGPGHLFSSSAVVQATSSLVLPRPAFRRAPSPLFSRREGIFFTVIVVLIFLLQLLLLSPWSRIVDDILDSVMLLLVATHNHRQQPTTTGRARLLLNLAEIQGAYAVLE